MKDVEFKVCSGEKCNGIQKYNLICISEDVEWILYVWDFLPDHEEIEDIKTTIMRAWRFYHRLLQVPSFDIGVEEEVQVWKNVLPKKAPAPVVEETISVEAPAPVVEETISPVEVPAPTFKVGDRVRNKLKAGYEPYSYTRKIGTIVELYPEHCIVEFNIGGKKYPRKYEIIELISDLEETIKPAKSISSSSTSTTPTPKRARKLPDLKKYMFKKTRKVKIIDRKSSLFGHIGVITDNTDGMVEVDFVTSKEVFTYDQVAVTNQRDVNYYKGDIVRISPSSNVIPGKVGVITKVYGNPKNTFDIKVEGKVYMLSRKKMQKVINVGDLLDRNLP